MANKFGTEINITPDQLETLKLIRRHKPFPQDDKLLLDLISKGLLFAETYIDYDGTARVDYLCCDITQDGIDYIKYARWDKAYKIYPYVISTLALIVAIAGFVVSLITRIQVQI